MLEWEKKGEYGDRRNFRLESFETIYQRYQAKIYGFLFKLCADAQLAEELTQETFYRAFVAFGKYKGNSSMFTWLAAIAKYTYFGYLKKEKQSRDAIALEDVVDFYMTQSYQDSAEDKLLRREITEKVREVLKELPQKSLEVVALRIYAEMSFKQVAETMEISESSAKVLYFRAKNMLKERLQDEFKL
ncbi:MAG: sigma-70 family RNA polymerase sigma factor [Lachnospiraceae bacterium]|nr:sigma-70 family RNA polymerase sigma factor [Lachnospiraceae bacterium]